MPKLILDASLVICWCEELEESIVFDGILESDLDPVMPERVVDEVKSDNSISEFVIGNSERRTCDEERYQDLSNRFFRLGSGEKAVLVLGERFNDAGEEYYCVLDDGRARKACAKLDLELIGTIGICKELIEQDFLEFEEAAEIIQEMKDSGTHLPENHRELLREGTGINGS